MGGGSWDQGPGLALDRFSLSFSASVSSAGPLMAALWPREAVHDFWCLFFFFSV